MGCVNRQSWKIEQTALTLNDTEMRVIEMALETREKILVMQSRAGTKEAQTQLGELKSLLRRLRRSAAARDIGTQTDTAKRSASTRVAQLFGMIK